MFFYLPISFPLYPSRKERQKLDFEADKIWVCAVIGYLLGMSLNSIVAKLL